MTEESLKEVVADFLGYLFKGHEDLIPSWDLILGTSEGGIQGSNASTDEVDGRMVIVVDGDYAATAPSKDVAATLLHESFHVFQFVVSRDWMTGKVGSVLEEDLFYFHDGNIVEEPARLTEEGYDMRYAYASLLGNEEVQKNILLGRWGYVLEKGEEAFAGKQPLLPKYFLSLLGISLPGEV